MHRNKREKGSNTIKIEETARHLIICEGIDDKNFLDSYIKAVFSENFFSTVQILPLGGVKKIRHDVMKNLINMEYFGQLQSFSIIQDADNNPSSAMDSVRGIFADAGLPVPDKPHEWKQCISSQQPFLNTGFLLFPSCDEHLEEGALERLCLQILLEPGAEEIIGEINKLMDFLRKNFHRKFDHADKSRICTYFATHDKYIDKMRIGLVAQSKKSQGFDWNHPKLEPLKNFLLELADSPAENKNNDSSQGEM